MKMVMNDFAIENIQSVLQNEIALGHAVVGVISFDDKGQMHFCWRTEDRDRAAAWEAELKEAVNHGITEHELVKLPKESC